MLDATMLGSDRRNVHVPWDTWTTQTDPRTDFDDTDSAPWPRPPRRRPEHRYGNRPTMKDVAARAGVGLKTVSRVVNGEAGVSPDTERRVQEAINALGFRRNDSARVLRKGRTASIGLVLEDLADPFYAPLSRAVEEVARAHGALLINGSSAEDPAAGAGAGRSRCAPGGWTGWSSSPPATTTATWSRRSRPASPPSSSTGPPGHIEADIGALRQLRRRARRRRPPDRARAPPHRLHRRPAAHPHRRERLRGYRAAMADGGPPGGGRMGVARAARTRSGCGPAAERCCARPGARHRVLRGKQPGDGHARTGPGGAGRPGGRSSASTTSSWPTCSAPGHRRGPGPGDSWAGRPRNCCSGGWTGRRRGRSGRTADAADRPRFGELPPSQ